MVYSETAAANYSNPEEIFFSKIPLTPQKRLGKPQEVRNLVERPIRDFDFTFIARYSVKGCWLLINAIC